MYKKRAIEDKIEYMSKHFPVVLVCGARQIGKTTVLKHFADKKGGINYVTLDYPRVRQLAKEDPELFLRSSRHLIFEMLRDDGKVFSSPYFIFNNDISSSSFVSSIN